MKFMYTVATHAEKQSVNIDEKGNGVATANFNTSRNDSQW